MLAAVLFGAAAQVRDSPPVLGGPELRERVIERATATGEPFGLARERVIVEELQREFEREVDQRTLAQLRRGALIALIALLALSVAIGYFVSGVVLRPVSEITDRARALHDAAPDLSGRIALGGPDDELKELADTLDAFLDRTEAAVEGQRRFLADASHELRTPITTAQTNLDVALSDPTASGAELRGAASVALEQLRRMGRLIGDLLFVERARAREPEHVSVPDLVEEVLTELATRAEAREVRLSGDGARGVAFANREDLRRALVNLVENAIVHNRPGGEVQVRTRPGAELLEILVEDDGPGIDPSEHDRIFHRFHRGGQGDGSGLGLAIVRELTERMGGEVAVESGSPTGARFVLRVPAGAAS